MEGIEVHANEGGVTKTRGGAYWLILPAGCNLLLHLFLAPEFYSLFFFYFLFFLLDVILRVSD